MLDRVHKPFDDNINELEIFNTYHFTNISVEDVREEAELNVEQIPEGRVPFIIYAMGCTGRNWGGGGGGNPGGSRASVFY